MRYTRIAAAAALFAAATPAVQAANLNRVVGLTDDNRLVTFDLSTPGTVISTKPIRNLLPEEQVLGIDFRPATGDLYAVTSQGRVLTVLPGSGRSAVESTLSTLPSSGLAGIDFNPTVDRLRLVGADGQNLRANVDTGVVTNGGDAALNPNTPTVTAAAYTNPLPGATSTTLFTIDTASDTLNIQNPPNNGTQVPVGSLGVDASDINGFDIRASDGLAVAAFTVDGVPGLYSINLSTGAATQIGPIGAGRIANLRGLAIPTPEVVTFGLTDANTLVSFNPAQPGKFQRRGPITGLNGGDRLVGLDFRPSTGELVGLANSGTLYTINPLTAVASNARALVANVADTGADGTAPYAGLSGTEFAVDFNPTGPVALRIVSDGGQNLRVGDPGTGATFTDGTIAAAPVSIVSAAYINSLPGVQNATQLYTIDASSGRLFTQNPPNNGTQLDIGSLGVAISSVDGFDITGSTNLALAALTPTGGSSTLYTVNLATGAATAVGAIGSGLSLSGLAHPITTIDPQADSTTYGLLADGRTLIRFARNTPGTVTTVGSISSLDLVEGDAFIDIDFRPSDGLLYGVTKAGEVFSIDSETAAATKLSDLAAAPIGLDPTPDFTSLGGAKFGIDFNPVPDRLRVVSNTGENLRINVASGATITDGTINRPAPRIVAAGYTKNFAGSPAGGTTLYVIDTNEDRLAIQSPPNNGVVAPVGPLGIALPDTGVSFDIIGGSDGVALLSADVSGDGKPELYRVNLATGAATLVGNLGGARNANVVGITSRLR